jgi:(E)-4-hydroxy-3-methyl-but-2-enyl pyrophosphate reductase
MARVKIAKNAGFCMGVRRAVDMALEASVKKNGPVYTYGPLIHNPQVLKILGEKGIRSLEREDIEGGILCPRAGSPGTIIIRAHGVSPEERSRIKEGGFQILNATCPHVGKVQGTITRYARSGHSIIIAGEKDHAEVIGLLGYTQGRGYVVNTPEEVDSLPPLEKVCLVAQTTQDQGRFRVISRAVEKKYPGAKIFDTICDSTHRRQDEVLALTRKVEAIVVVGGRGSGNTRRLTKISEEAGVPTFHVETEGELDLEELSGYSTVGVTAGASTPNWQILRVVERLQDAWLRRGLTSLTAGIGRLAAISYLLLAIGAGCLAYASALLQGMPLKLSWILVAALYVFSMHVINRLSDKASELFNQPGRTDFYEQHGKIMVTAGIISAVLAVTLAWFQGVFPFYVLLAISGLGMVYNLRIFPVRPGGAFKYQKIKDIPGSKTLLVSLAWGVVISLLPSLSEEGWPHSGTIVAFLYSTILVFVRSTLYDFKDLQGDLMVGKETIPIVLGKRNTEMLVMLLLVSLGCVLALAAPLGWATSLSPFLLLSLGYAVFYYLLYRNQVIGPGFLFEGIVDGSFIFAGLIAFLWALVYS